MHLKPAEIGFLLLVAAYIALSFGLTLITGFSEHFKPVMYLGTGLQVTTMFLGFYLLYRLIRALWILLSSLRAQRSNPEQQNGLPHRSKAPPRNDERIGVVLWQDLKDGPLDPELYKRGLPIFIGFFFFFSTFTSMKILIPQINPFDWDIIFLTADRMIHFGVDPWRLLQPILGYPWITKLIGLTYIFWLPAVFMVIYWQMFRRGDDALRMQFFYTFVLSWAINGTFLAIFFSSGGPCYVEHILGSDYYAELMNYLRGVDAQMDIYAIYTQDLLWRNYADKDFMLGGGISAFPSIHVATAFLFLLVARHASKAWFIGFTAFFIMILLGSVHLGWHYAVDGYFSILTTCGLWWISGKILDSIVLQNK